MGPLRLQSRILDAFAVSAVAARLGLGCEEEVSGAQRESETASCVAARLALHFRVVPQGRGPCALS